MENLKMIRLSIIVPIYNVELYLRKCVDSLLCQDLPKDEYEIILVDDGSTDNSGAIADELAGKRQSGGENIGPEIRVLHQKNAGVAVARNNGVVVARGAFVAFLDADDWWTPDHARKMLELADLYPDAGLYSCRYWYVKHGRNEDRITNLVWTDRAQKVARCGCINYFRSYYEGGAMPVCMDTAMFHKSVFEQMGGFPLGIALGEDFLLWAKTALYYPVAYRDECLAYYNNDVPMAFRLTKKLHAPERHMLFCLGELEMADNVDLQHLLDKLRASGLLAYWMDTTYHAQAAKELAKIDWTHLPPSARKPYDTPIAVLKLKRLLLTLASRCKQFCLTLNN